MQEDLRQAKRIALLTQPKGELHLFVQGESYSVYSVLDVSPEGIGVQLKHAVEILEEVEIQYIDKDINLRVNGTVAWSRQKSDQAATDTTDQFYEIGINLISPHLLISQMIAD